MAGAGKPGGGVACRAVIPSWWQSHGNGGGVCGSEGGGASRSPAAGGACARAHGAGPHALEGHNTAGVTPRSWYTKVWPAARSKHGRARPHGQRTGCEAHAQALESGSGMTHREARREEGRRCGFEEKWRVRYIACSSASATQKKGKGRKGGRNWGEDQGKDVERQQSREGGTRNEDKEKGREWEEKGRRGRGGGRGGRKEDQEEGTGGQKRGGKKRDGKQERPGQRPKPSCCPPPTHTYKKHGAAPRHKGYPTTIKKETPMQQTGGVLAVRAQAGSQSLVGAKNARSTSCEDAALSLRLQHELGLMLMANQSTKQGGMKLGLIV
eukprot:364310-Chlamydomonas_euryale.AAC.11